MKITICSPVRQSLEIFKLFGESIKRLELPVSYELEYDFTIHNSPDVVEFCKENSINHTIYEDDTDYGMDEFTHIGKPENIKAVVDMKNAMIKRNEDSDYIFFVDSDIVLEHDTLRRLLEADKEVISQTFGTKGTPESEPMPNSGDFDKYEFIDYNRFKGSGIIEVGMTGACTLIKREVFETGANFSPIRNLKIGGEDRGFCIKLAVHGIEVGTDLRNPAFHIYRPSDIEQAKKILNL